MAALPEEDAPTVTGTPGERRVDHPVPPLARDVDEDGDDTTTAEAGPPAPRSEPPGEQDEEDRTVQQQVSAPPAMRKPPPVPRPSGAPSAPSVAPKAPLARASSKAAPVPSEEDPIEDSITATAPRVEGLSFLESPLSSGRGLPLTIPGSIEIRTVEHDDLLDETEVRTQPGLAPLDIPAAVHAGRPEHSSSQPPPPPRPAAGRPASMPAVLPAPYDEDEDGDDDDGVTTQAPAPRVGTLPGLGARPPSTKPSAADRPVETKRGLAPPIVVDAVDEPPTRPGVAEADEPPTRPGVEGVAEPPTTPAVDDIDRPTSHSSPTGRAVTEVETSKRIELGSFANDGDDGDDESVTTRAPAVEPYDGDSVTTQAPAVPAELIEAASKGARPDSLMDDTTGGTTHKVKKARASLASSPADGESESITTQAPGPLTNILRVLASESSPDTGSAAMAMLEEDEPPENRTAVMANAPLKRIVDGIDAASRLPHIRPTDGSLQYGSQAAAATNLSPTSESGLRVARTGSGSEERASLGALLGGGDARISGVSRTMNADGSISGAMDARAHPGAEMAFPQAPQQGAQPSVHDVDLGKGPRYGLLVAVVAVISVIVPVTLFVVLRLGSEATPATPGAPSELTSEVQKHDPPRAKGVRGKNGMMVSASAAASASAAPSASASVSPSASASGKPPVPPRGGFPFRR